MRWSSREGLISGYSLRKLFPVSLRIFCQCIISQISLVRHVASLDIRKKKFLEKEEISKVKGRQHDENKSLRISAT